MASWIECVTKNFAGRGIRLNAPARPEDISSLLSVSPVPVPPSDIEVFEHFDGFCEEDVQSNIFLWSAPDIVDHLRQTDRRREYIPIADLFIGSELICLNETGEVFWQDRKSRIAKGYVDFMTGLSEGVYDT